jgi:glucose/arabinose dehydrogenase
VSSAPRIVLLVSAAIAGACGQSTPAAMPTPTPIPTAATCADGPPVSGTPSLTTTLFARGFDQPLDVQSAPGDRTRVFVVEQTGRIRIVRGGSLLATPFLNIASRVRSGGEQGLLGLAFHPRYGENGRFFVNYTDTAGDTHISEFRATPPASDTADPASERELLFVRQPFANHNGGGLTFGPDGMLYIGLGDGGSAGDPMGNGQSLGAPLGKLLRIDVDRGSPFAVPPDNPFVSTPGAFAPVWAYGLRNPWRFAFDRATGELFIADVGQNAVEEVDVAPAGRGGQNYGWNVMEGSRCFRPASGCNMAGLTLPLVEYNHNEGCSITGGVVYRGCRLPGYLGTYFYGDFCTAFIRSFRMQNGAVVDRRDWTAPLGRGVNSITSFGVDAEGEVYIVDQDGEVYKIVPG